jgi:hypothetical protein
MKAIPVTVTDQDGHTVPAQQMRCPDCDGQGFLIFLIDEKHYHLQCLDCDTSFCDGSCNDKAIASD